MAYDDDLVERIRGVLPQGLIVTEQKMFGGLAFLVGGHLAVAASGSDRGSGGLMVRCPPSRTDAHVALAGVSRVVMRSRELDGWLRVEPACLHAESTLRAWVEVGTSYAGSLPSKG